MKKNLPVIFAAAACLLLLLCLYQVHLLRQDLQYVRSNLENRISQVDDSVDTIAYRVQSALEQENNLLAFWNAEPVGIDPAQGTASLRFSVTPKEYGTDTTAILTCGGAQYPMASDGSGSFTAELSVPLFEETSRPSVCFLDGDRRRVQEISWAISPMWEMLPNFDARFSGSSSGSYGASHYIFRPNGAVEIHMFSKSDGDPIQSVELIELLDGEELSRKPIPRQDDGTYSLPLADPVEIPNGQRWELVVEAVDTYGLHYRALISCVNWDGNTVRQSEPAPRGVIYEIYDSEGNLLYAPVLK